MGQVIFYVFRVNSAIGNRHLLMVSHCNQLYDHLYRYDTNYIVTNYNHLFHCFRYEDSPTDSEKAAKVQATIEKKGIALTHTAVMEELLSEVEECKVYRPQRAELQMESSFSEHLQKLMADYEVSELLYFRSLKSTDRFCTLTNSNGELAHTLCL